MLASPRRKRLLFSPRQDAIGAAFITKKEKDHDNEQRTKKQPVKQFRIGAISATIWLGSITGPSPIQRTIERSYKDKEGKWQRTSSFELGDLYVVEKLAPQAARFIEDLQFAE